MKNVSKKSPSILLMIVLVGFPQISESIFTPVLPQLSRALRVSAQTRTTDDEHLLHRLCSWCFILGLVIRSNRATAGNVTGNCRLFNR